MFGNHERARNERSREQAQKTIAYPVEPLICIEKGNTVEYKQDEIEQNKQGVEEQRVDLIGQVGSQKSATDEKCPIHGLEGHERLRTEFSRSSGQKSEVVAGENIIEAADEREKNHEEDNLHTHERKSLSIVVCIAKEELFNE